MIRALVFCVLAALPLGFCSSETQKGLSSKEVAKETDYLALRLRNIQKQGVQMFVADVSAGTPPQMMEASLDMTSNITYVTSESCEDPVCRTHRRYDSSSSSTYEADGMPFDLGYGSGISGILSRDVLGFAGISLANQTFGEAIHMVAEWQHYLPNDGSISLAYSGPILDDLKEQGLISQRMFGMYFGSGDDDGELTLGGINEDRYTGEIQYVDILYDRWLVHVEEVGFENKTGLDLCGTDGCKASFTSGSPYFFVSMEAAVKINRALGAKPMPTPGLFFFDCTRVCDMPSMSLTVGGHQYSLSARDYTLVSTIEGGLQLCLSGFLGTSYIPDHVFTVGTLFMQKVYTVYDKENGRIGFADSN